MSSKMTTLNALVESYLTWALSLSGELAAFTLLIAFAALSTLELNHPKRRLSVNQLRQSYRTNVSLFVFNSIVISLVSATPLLMVAERYSDRGLLTFIAHPAWKALLAFLALDLLLYFWHRASHNFDSLWMFHKVHHNDPYLNVSTAFRIHVVEVLIITVLKTAYIILLGVNQTMVLTNEALLTMFIMFHHTNISFRGEQRLGQVIITPYLHRVHHSTERNEHDSNYGAVFSIWDCLFGTLAELEPAEIGIKNSSPQTVLGLVKFGFISAIAPASMQPSANPAPVSAYEPDMNLKTMIAEAAYYKAEKRAFMPGNELLDWLEAKREIIRMVYGDKPVKKQATKSAYISMRRPFTLC